MNGLRVKIKGSNRAWDVLRDHGDQMIVTWQHSESRIIRRSDVTSREEPGIGWVPTEIPA